MEQNLLKRFTCEEKDCWFVRVSDGNTNTTALPLVVIPTMADLDTLVPNILAEVLPLVQNKTCSPFVLAGFAANNWDNDCTPWPAPALSKKEEDFQGGGDDTLNWIEESFLPEIARQTPVLTDRQNTSIMGYSLGGLFSLWAFYETDLFGGCASCSGSLWYDGWEDYMETHQAKPGSRVYLSLGGAEEKVKNPRVATVGDMTRKAADILKSDPNVMKTTLQWHKGGHYTDIPHRLAQGLAFLVER